jgi:putative FmdB family regulatory protein
MPLYTYDCSACGLFQSARSIAEFEADAECPGCGARTPRSLAAPMLMAMPANTRQAYARNEKSAWSPEVVRREAGGHVHSADCGHGHGGSGKKNHQHGGKPWMVGHSH